LLNHFYPDSFPNPLHLPFEEKRATGEYLTMEEAAQYVRLTERQLRELMKARRISYARIDYRNYRFKRSDLDAWFEACKVQRNGVYGKRSGVWDLVSGVKRA
jgi:excisionase family DNA binding protein